jgi:hypothetical protein
MADVGPRDEFVNQSDGFIGVITIDPNGKERAIAVRSGASVWLSEAEQILTANAPRKDEDNPFANGDLKLRTRAADIKNRRPIGAAQDETTEAEETETPSPNGSSPEVVDLSAVEEKQAEKPEKPRAKADKERQKAEQKRQAEAKKQAEAGAVPVKETGASVSPKGIPEVGKRAAGEEVGNPEAPAQEKSEE